MQHARSARAPGVHGWCSTKCQEVPGVSSAHGALQVRLGGQGKARGQAEMARWANFQCKAKVMSKQFTHSSCSTKCQGHPEGCSGDKNFQIIISLDAKENDKVILARAKIHSTSFWKNQIWTENKGHHCMHPKYPNGSKLLDIRVW